MKNVNLVEFSYPAKILTNSEPLTIKWTESVEGQCRCVFGIGIDTLSAPLGLLIYVDLTLI